MSVVSLNPDKAFTPAGQYQQGDVLLTEPRFRVHTYKEGGTPVIVTAVKVTPLNGDLEPSAPPRDQYMFLGGTTAFRPSLDGKSEGSDEVGTEGPFLYSGNGNTPGRDTATMMFLTGLVEEAGFDKTKLDSGDIRVLDGMKLYFDRREDPSNKEYHIAVPTKIHSNGAAPKAAKSKKAASSDDVAEEATTVIKGQLADLIAGDDPGSVSGVRKAVITHFMGSPNAKKAKALLLDGLVDEVVAESGGKIDGDKITF